MNNNRLELALSIATSDYGVIQNGVVVMDGLDIYRVQQYHIVFEQATVDITPVNDGIVCAYTIKDNEGMIDEIGVLESYDEFVDLMNDCVMSFGGVIR